MEPEKRASSLISLPAIELQVDGIKGVNLTVSATSVLASHGSERSDPMPAIRMHLSRDADVGNIADGCQVAYPANAHAPKPLPPIEQGQVVSVKRPRDDDDMPDSDESLTEPESDDEPYRWRRYGRHYYKAFRKEQKANLGFKERAVLKAKEIFGDDW
ncbi:hypothetical protein BN946_scf184652.g24 [Trametes cinnabarina]|uniref:Uncharacterized protein n=1 Tax=Pycnoporus cinnabarinus TaxID=5643 RepID=A0A060S2T6_PYCCI|nr:hypothetical protein BN946_scf184652.g24 [Trametes cinnabarina]